MSELMPGYHTLRGSDLQRDGMFLELIEHRTGNVVAEVFYSDVSGAMSVSVHQPDIPLETIERLIQRARQMLPPIRADHIELCTEDECQTLEAFLVERVYDFNAQATGYTDGRLLGGRLRNDVGEVIAAFNGHTWGGCCVIAHLWVHEAHRRLGLGRDLLQTAEAEAVRRGCEQVVLSTHSFQAPEFYERAGYERRAVISDWPKGHSDIVYVKRLSR